MIAAEKVDIGCRVVPLTAELLHLAVAMEADPMIADMVRAPGIVLALLQPGLSFAVMQGGALICVAGIFRAHYGKANGWMMTTPLASRKHLAFVTRKACEHFAEWQKDPAFRRIEIHIRDDQPWRQTFARRLGMTEGFGPMRAWDAVGRDYWVYARVA